MTSDNEYEAKIELIKSLNSQDEIIDFARNDSDWNVRQFAVSHIEDEQILKDILVNDSITSVSIKAMGQINDIDFLIDTCLNNPFSRIRLATLNRIIDESLLGKDDLADLLSKVALNDPNDFIVRLAVENGNFNDREVLKSIAESNRGGEIRKIAVSKIDDEGILSDFALNDSNALVRRESILNSNLNDLDVLGEAIKNDGDEFNRQLACERITDGNYLVGMIFDKSFHHRLDDLSLNSSLDCEDYFEGVYEDSDDEYCRLASVVFIKDSIVLDGIVVNESNDAIRLKAINNKYFSNPDILKGLIQSESDSDILLSAISKIEDEAILIEFIKKHSGGGKATLEAILNVSDIEFLRELSQNQNPEIRLYAVKSLSNNFKEEFNPILKDIALADESKEVCLEAVGPIKDSCVLMEIVDKSNDNDVRGLALVNIPTPKLLDNFLLVHTSNRQSLNIKQRFKSLSLNEKDDVIRRIAISKLNDKETLDNIISLNNDDSKVAQERLDTLFEDIKRVENESQLKHLISSEDCDVSYVAQKTFDDIVNSPKRVDEINQTSDIEKLKSIINDDFNYYVRSAAEGKLERLLFNVRLDEIDEKANQDKFMDIVKDDTFPLEIRKKAFSKITDEKFKEGIAFN